MDLWMERKEIGITYIVFYELMRSYTNFEFPYPLIRAEVPDDVSGIVVIPAYNEPEIEKTLFSLTENKNYQGSVEVIIIINESENSPETISEFHKSQYEYLKNWAEQNNSEKLKFFPIYINKIKAKEAGVGIARKIGMDEAYKRFISIGNPYGIIACLDADTLTAQNYIEVLAKESQTKNRIKAYSIYFEHDLECIEDAGRLSAIIDYEMHLRYYINMQRTLGLPYAFYTVGSAMAVRAYAYSEVFGMNKRQAGEDFYFLHKFIKTGFFKEINTTKVFPSARTSDRVPFGTGKAIMRNSGSVDELLTYNFKSFESLESMTSNLDLAYQDSERFFDNLTPPIQKFLKSNGIEDKLDEIKKHTASVEMFKKRFYAWFDAFRLMKYMHFCRNNFFQDIPVSIAVQYLTSRLNLTGRISKKKYLEQLRIRDHEN